MFLVAGGGGGLGSSGLLGIIGLQACNVVLCVRVEGCLILGVGRCKRMG